MRNYKRSEEPLICLNRWTKFGKNLEKYYRALDILEETGDVTPLINFFNSISQKNETFAQKLKSYFKSLKDKMNRWTDAGHVKEANALVPRYNSLVPLYNKYCRNLKEKQHSQPYQSSPSIFV